MPRILHPERKHFIGVRVSSEQKKLLEEISAREYRTTTDQLRYIIDNWDNRNTNKRISILKPREV